MRINIFGNRSFTVAALLSSVAAVMILAANIAGFRDLFFVVFSWHREQPEFIHGIFELSAFALALLGVIRFCRDFRLLLLLVALLCWGYLRLHAVDFAVLMSALYVAGILSAGILLDKMFFRGATLESAIGVATCFAIGVIALGILLLLCSLLFGVSFELVRLLSILFCISALLLIIFIKGVEIKRVVYMEWRPGWLQAVAWTLLLALGLAVMARSNVVIFYDSIWYGMRPDRVLFGPTGFYDFLGLTTQVHYYPKLYELLIAPLQGWGDHSVAIGFGVASLFIFSYAVFIVGRTAGLDFKIAFFLAVAVACVPAAAGTAETTKGDLLASAFVLFGLAALLHGYRGEGLRYLAFCAMFALLASTLRLSVLPWLGLLFILFVLVAGGQMLAVVRQPKSHRGELWSIWLVVAALLVTILIHYRTLLLTGTPIVTNGVTQERLAELGFELLFPIGAFTGRGEPDGFSHMLGYFHELALMPSRYRFHVIKWMGATWLGLLPFVFLSFIGRSWRERGMLGAILFIAMGFPLLLAYNAWQVEGGDGNYFLVPIVCLCVLGLVGLRASSWLAGSLLSSAMLAFAVFLVGANWVQGTEVFNGKLTRSVFDERQQMDAHLEKSNLLKLGDALRNCPRETRVIGMLPQHSAFALPIRFEPLQELAWNNRAAISSTSGIRYLLDATYTQLVILPAPEHLTEVGRFFEDVNKASLSANFMRLANAEHGRELLLNGIAVDKYIIYQVSGAKLDVGCLAGIRRSAVL